MNEKKELTIIIPVYNERRQIGSTFEFFSGLVKEHQNIEVIFVDDGSVDGTKEFFQSNNQQETMKVISCEKNKGYGASLKKGIKKATGEYIAITDADGTYPQKKILELFNKIVADDLDMVVGWRKYLKDNSFLKNIVRDIIRRIAESVSGENIPDLNSGLRVFKRSIAIRFLKSYPNGFSFTSTITLLMLSNNFKVEYVPIEYEKRKGRSKFHPINDTLNLLQLIIRIIFYFNPFSMMLKMSVIFLMLSMLVLVGSYLFGRVMDITTILLFTTSVNMFVIGLVADLINKRFER